MRPGLPVLISVTALALSAPAQVKITKGADKIDIEIGGKPYSTFYMVGAEVTKPYLWPVRAASGTYVTRAFPMEKIPKKPTGLPIIRTSGASGSRTTASIRSISGTTRRPIRMRPPSAARWC